MITKLSSFFVVAVLIALTGLIWVVVHPVYKDFGPILLKTQNGSIISFRAALLHRVDDWKVGDGDDRLTKSLKVSQAAFESQLSRISRQGFSTITTEELVQAYLNKRTLPPNSILLTFDDGFEDNYVNAFRLLKKYNMVGDFAIVTGLVGVPGFLTWDQVREMKSAGMGISSHTVSHCNLVAQMDDKQLFTDHPFLDPQLDQTRKPCGVVYGFSVLSEGQIQYELETSKQAILDQIGVATQSIVYPVGSYDKTVTKIAKQSGYSIGFTTESPGGGVVTDPFAIPRTRIKGTP